MHGCIHETITQKNQHIIMSGPGSNCNERVTLHFQGIKNWRHSTGGRLVSYLEHQMEKEELEKQRKREREREKEIVWFDLVWFICLRAYQLLKCNLIPKFYSFENVCS